MQHRDDEIQQATDVPADLEPAASPAAPVEGGVRRERLLPGTIDEAWLMLRDAEGLERWLAERVDLVVAPGERGELHDDGVVREVLVESVDEGRRLSLRWWTGDDEPSVVDLTLDELDGRTRLVVTELPLRLVSAPPMIPAAWTAPGDFGAGGSPASGPQLLALAAR